MSVENALKGSLLAHLILLLTAILLSTAGLPAASVFSVLVVFSYVAFLFPATCEVIHSRTFSREEKRDWLLRLLCLGSIGGLLYFFRGRPRLNSWP